ncbi:MAG: DUF4384 domain-containing protein [Desulfobacterales bacterium]|nr:DUF4384 domain-containing protein [Desulfobacterales bacterium]
MKKTIPVLLFLLLSLVSSISFSAEKPLWIEATGEAVLGDIETPNEVKERARRDAQKNALEMAVGVFMKSHTLVSNSQLVEDLVYATVRGRVEKSEILQEGWDPKDRSLYRVKLKALIQPVYPEKGEGLSVKVHLSKTTIKAGEDVRIFYEPSRDCYIYIFSIASDGSVTLLLPNSHHTKNLATSNTVHVFPPEESPIRLTAAFLPGHTEKYAEERIKLIATRKKENLIPLGFQEGLFKVYDSKSTGMISDLVRRLNHLEPGDWTEATVVYNLTR